MYFPDFNYRNLNGCLSDAWHRVLCHISTSGVSLAGIVDAAEKIGLRWLAVKINFHSSDTRPGLIDFPLPCIAHWHQNHFVVIYKISRDKVYIADPGHGKIRLSRSDFFKNWLSDGEQGIVLGLESMPDWEQDAIT